MDQNNEKWAAYWAHRFSWALAGRGDMDMEDLMQAARLGILLARENYREGEGSWASYSGCYIKREIMRALGIRRGVLPPRAVSLDAPVTEDEETLLDTLLDESLPEPDEEVLLEELQREVREAVARIGSENQRRSVAMSMLDGQTLAQTAARLGVSAERTRQLIRAAKRKLRQDQRLRALAEMELCTRYHAHLGVEAFLSTHTSVVEQAVIWRQEQREKIMEMGAEITK